MGSSDKKKTSNCNKNQLMMPKYYSKEEMIEIQAEAYYKVYKRIEEEKRQKEDAKKAGNEAKRKEKRGFCKLVGMVVWMIISPLTAKKKCLVRNDITNGFFAMISSFIMYIVGYGMRVIGTICLITGFVELLRENIPASIFFVDVEWCIIVFIFSSIIILSGHEIATEEDGNKIMMYTTSVFAMIGIIISLITLFTSLKL